MSSRLWIAWLAVLLTSLVLVLRAQMPPTGTAQTKPWEDWQRARPTIPVLPTLKSPTPGELNVPLSEPLVLESIGATRLELTVNGTAITLPANTWMYAPANGWTASTLYTITARGVNGQGVTELYTAQFTTGAAVQPLVLGVTPDTVQAGGRLTVTWAHIPAATPTDWFAIFLRTANDYAHGNAWRYVSCSQTAGTVALPSGSCEVVIPAGQAPGEYDLRLFAADDYTRLAREPFAVIAAPVIPPVDPPPSGGTIAATSCQAADIQAAHDRAADGQTVTVPAGTCNISATIRLSKTITLQGAGIGQTVLRDTTPDNYGCHTGILQWTLKPGGRPRLTGFTFDGGSGQVLAEGAGCGMTNITGSNANFRVDHNRFISAGRYTLMYVGTPSGDIRGVWDHNVMDITGSHQVGFAVSHPNWQSVGAWGDSSWASLDSIGTVDQIVFEDNVCNSYGDANEFVDDYAGGARWTARRNVLKSCFFSGHGTESGGRARASRHVEIYRNTSTNPLGSFMPLAGMRGGTGLLFGNTLDDYTTLLTAGAQRNETWRGQYWPFGMAGGTAPPMPGGGAANSTTSLTASGGSATATFRGTPWDGGGSVAVWGPQDTTTTYLEIYGASIPALNGIHQGTWVDHLRFRWATSVTGNATAFGRSPWDGNQETTGWPVLDQPGRGRQLKPWNSADVVPPPVWPENELAPIYAWDNTNRGAVALIENYFGEHEMRADRDFYNATSGPIAQRPGNCTARQMFWETGAGEWDAAQSGPDGQRWECTAANVWALRYGQKADGLPLQYPHPLVSGAVVADVARVAETQTADAPVSRGRWWWLAVVVLVVGGAGSYVYLRRPPVKP